MECGRIEEDVDNMVYLVPIDQEELVQLRDRQEKDSGSFPLIELGSGYPAKLI